MLRRGMMAASSAAGPTVGAFAYESSQTAGSITTTSSYADFLDVTINVTIGMNLLCRFVGSFYGGGDFASVRLLVDGVVIGEASATANNSGWAKSIAIQAVGAVAAGSHVVKLQVKHTGSSVGFGQTNNDAILTVQEF